MWVEELINGHPDRIRHELGVRKHVFKQLVDELSSHGYKHSEHATLEEQLCIFLYTCVTGFSCRHVAERFQLSKDVISMYLFFSLVSPREYSQPHVHSCFREILVAFSSPPIYTKYIKLPCSEDPTPSRIADDPGVYPFFKDAIGAIDGAHIACTPSTPALKWLTRNRRGFRSQISLVCCNFDLEFMYVLSGWEGSTADAHIYDDARTTHLTIPIGKYCLADVGYSMCPQLLLPYRLRIRCVPTSIVPYSTTYIRPKDPRAYTSISICVMHNFAMSSSEVSGLSSAVFGSS